MLVVVFLVLFFPVSIQLEINVIHIPKHISYDRSNVSVGRSDYVCWGEGNQHNLDVAGEGIYRSKTMFDMGGGGQKLLIF